MSPGDRYRLDVKRLPCEICVRKYGMDPDPWPESNASDAHHPRTGAGAGRKNSDFDCIALCKAHHQGDPNHWLRNREALHHLGRKKWEELLGVTEGELSDSTRHRVLELRGQLRIV
jgi:hypothetical protein